MNHDYLLRYHLNTQYHPKRNDYFFISTLGSMNYGLDTVDSDCDSRLVLIPNIKDIVYPASAEQDITRLVPQRDNEYCYCHDIRHYTSCLLKYNPNFLESLYAKSTIVNPKYEDIYQQLFDMREDIAYCAPLSHIRTMRGMLQTEKNKVEQSQGKDKKAAYHCLRLCNMLADYYRGRDYQTVILSSSMGTMRDVVLKVKHGKMSDEKTLSLVLSFYQSEKNDFDFFVNGSGPKEYNRGFFETDVFKQVEAIVSKVILRGLKHLYEIREI